MIVSYARRFIFIKPRKVGGTSVELFLSRFCGADDIVTPVSPKDEPLRQGDGPRNYRIPGYGKGRMLRLIGNAVGRPALGRGGFYNHMPAGEIRRLIGEQAWAESFKFTVERNPWDRQVSLYHWHYRHRARKPSFEAFIRSPFRRKISHNFDLYAIGGTIAVDRVCRFETLRQDLAAALAELGIEAEIDLPRTKVSRDRADWRGYYTPETRDIVAGWYWREIEAFGYCFES
jgi:hypothetical protein